MIHSRHCAVWALLLVLFALVCPTANAQSPAVVPRLVNFSGKASDAQGKAITGGDNTSCKRDVGGFDLRPCPLELRS
jgi:hypothetical protein